MKLVCVPWWVMRVVDREKLPLAALMDKQRLAPYMSKRDLVDYDTAFISAQHYFDQVYGLSIDDDYPKLGLQWMRPLTHDPESVGPIEGTPIGELYSDQQNGDQRFENLVSELVGYPLGSDQSLTWYFHELPCPAEPEPVYGAFAGVFDATSGCYASDYRRICDELLELLYAHNRPIQQLAQTRLMGTFMNRLTHNRA